LPEPDSSRRQTPRRRLPAVRAVVGLASLSLSLALPVLAQESSDAPTPAAEQEISVSLALTGPPGCGSENDLAARIAWRTNRVRFVKVGASERHLDVTLETAPGSATATLSLALPNGRRATRVLRAATCDEAVDAAALVAAVTLDPTASTSPTTPAPDAGTPDGSGGTGGAAPPPTATARPEPQGGTGGVDASRSELSAALFVAGELVAGPAPSPLYGVGFGAMGVWERGSILSPAARVSFVHFFGREFDELGGTAYFSLNELSVDLCPFRIGNEVVAIFACGSFSLGELTAEGRETNDATAQKLDWLALGGTLLLELRPVDFFEVELFGTLGAPLARDSFQFGCPAGAADCRPNLFHEVPRLTAGGGVALGVFFR
jgi:hypothetical protein